jgi:hypothetical protein
MGPFVAGYRAELLPAGLHPELDWRCRISLQQLIPSAEPRGSSAQNFGHPSFNPRQTKQPEGSSYSQRHTDCRSAPAGRYDAKRLSRNSRGSPIAITISGCGSPYPRGPLKESEFLTLAAVATKVFPPDIVAQLRLTQQRFAPAGKREENRRTPAAHRQRTWRA